MLVESNHQIAFVTSLAHYQTNTLQKDDKLSYIKKERPSQSRNKYKIYMDLTSIHVDQ
jgi:hypothetical protein